jgi:hypothetical protein
MQTDDFSDFTVDVPKREVTHKSGASVTFYEYPNEADWLSAGGVSRNPHLYDGPLSEFVDRARKAAIAAGMTHATP